LINGSPLGLMGRAPTHGRPAGRSRRAGKYRSATWRIRSTSGCGGSLERNPPNLMPDVNRRESRSGDTTTCSLASISGLVTNASLHGRVKLHPTPRSIRGRAPSWFASWSVACPAHTTAWDAGQSPASVTTALSFPWTTANPVAVDRSCIAPRAHASARMREAARSGSTWASRAKRSPARAGDDESAGSRDASTSASTWVTSTPTERRAAIRGQSR
jgi:hypothetical protein